MSSQQPAQTPTPQGGNNQGNKGGGNRVTRKTRDNSTYPRRVTDKYCWTHGGGSHISAVWNSKFTGHQYGATFANCMGGSNAYCPTWLGERVDSINNIITQLSYKYTTYSSPYRKQKTIIAKGDSGASHHYFKSEDQHVLQYLKNELGPSVTQPDNTSLQSLGSWKIPISPALSSSAQHAMILTNLKSSSLISMGQLCDDGCVILLTEDKLRVLKNNKLILNGTRNGQDDLWDIPIRKTSMSPQNYTLPPTHSDIYTDITNSVPKQQIPIRTEIPPKHKTSIEYKHFIDNMSLKHCIHLVRQQLHSDKKALNFKVAHLYPKYQKLAVIIRKKETHSDLAKYLHAACYLPVAHP